MNCISEYISYYYNYYCGPKKNKIDVYTTKKNSVSKIEIDKTYDLIFSNNNNSSQKLNIVLYEIYNYGVSIDNKKKPSIFLFNNQVYKITLLKNIKNYLSVLNTIRNYNIKNVLIPNEIYFNKFQCEIVQIYKYYKDGDLFDYFTENILSYTEVFNIFYQIITIVHNLHAIGLVHLDLKLENFLIEKIDLMHYKDNYIKQDSYNYNSTNDLYKKNESDKIRLHLIDFDFSHINNNINFYGGTEQYASYEIRNHKRIKNWCCCDIWSCCIILYILLFREFPWQCCDIDDITFNNYINNYTNDYWYNKLSELKLEEKYIVAYSKIFNYGFNLRNEERSNINVILNILKNI